jgi:replicative DNA helicase
MELITPIKAEIETAIIAQVIGIEGAFFVASDYLTESNFGDPLKKKLWRMCQDLVNEKKPIDRYMLKARLPLSSEANLILSEYIEQVFTTATNLPYHCMQLVELSIRLHVYNLSQKVVTPLLGGAGGGSDINLKDFQSFQDHLIMEKGYNDLFQVLEKGYTYFRGPLPGLAAAIAKAMHEIEQKADRIHRKHGRQLLQRQQFYYEFYGKSSTAPIPKVPVSQ